jgi:1-acyl-sn-glycerol-3-phosphate acyltransferase
MPAIILGTLTFSFFCLNTLFWCVLIFIFTAIKIFVPGTGAFCSRVMVGFAERWISGNTLNMALAHKIKWDVSGLEGLAPDRSYLVCANHQTWVDITVLQKVFNRRIPFLRFFLKQQLLYVPLLGAAWLALDFPFMKRHSKEYLAKHPEKRGEDLATTRRACEKFRGHPISILNFLEGTRFTTAKHRAQGSTFNNLLLPKMGGIAFVLEAMGEQFDSLLDVTIFYPQGPQSIWGLFSGRVQEVVVRVERYPIPSEFLGSRYHESTQHRKDLRHWLSDIWARTDRMIDGLRSDHQARK